MNNDWKVQEQVRYNLKIEQNNYRTFREEPMYNISKVKKMCPVIFEQIHEQIHGLAMTNLIFFAEEVLLNQNLGCSDRKPNISQLLIH
jgi:hypothetical protein